MSKLTEASASPSPSNPTSLGETYVQNLQVLIKTPVYHLEKRLPSRTLVSIHPHEEVPTPTPTTKLRLRPLLLSLTPGSDNNNGPRAISGPHKQEYCDTSGLIQGVCILHKEQHAARELNSDQLPSGRMRNPNRRSPGLGQPPGSRNDLRVPTTSPDSEAVPRFCRIPGSCH
ncbi:hypothetical protein F2Q70_00029954 [Brassica cretica]|uniref:Uncharacterized protein n=1 Tax=Brassica cretica TaxID=69181 RepID=A0A8S9FFV8_BRACR|nr:hypothetical protein F2Q70_00029954 [Brassica cretica]KAF2551909.1 hypothetical protein F2Q68_00034428 [Brassica cretica]